MSSFFLLASLLAVAQGSSPAQTPNTLRYAPHSYTKEEQGAVYREWEAGLREICEVENIEAMVFDIEPAYGHVEPWKERYGAESMRILGYATKRRWLQVDGVQVFTRVGFSFRPPGMTDTLMAILSGLDEDGVRRLTEQGLTLGDLGSAADQMLPYLAWDPSMAKVLVERGQNIRVQATFAPQFEYTDPKTGRRVVDQLGEVDTGPPWTEAEVAAHPLPFVPYDPHTPGTLDFGPGAVITLDEFRRKAELAFGTGYELDARLMNAPLFVRGSMSQATFEKIYNEVASAVPPAAIRRSSREEALRELLESKASLLAQGARNLHGLTPDDFLNGRTLTAGEMAQLDPKMGEYLKDIGLSPSDRIRLRPGVMFTFDAGGTRTIGFANAGGKRISYGASNRIRLGIR
ncbi:MAG: hypothetical protein KatS3mg015_1943 [Fimbriimonadales bacterium]|nr:MAG: hypothetical protein KatS3mg015_1943 [Fimbriimonadales bacterium]